MYKYMEYMYKYMQYFLEILKYKKKLIIIYFEFVITLKLKIFSIRNHINFEILDKNYETY